MLIPEDDISKNLIFQSYITPLGNYVLEYVKREKDEIYLIKWIKKYNSYVEKIVIKKNFHIEKTVHCYHPEYLPGGSILIYFSVDDVDYFMLLKDIFAFFSKISFCSYYTTKNVIGAIVRNHEAMKGFEIIRNVPVELIEKLHIKA